MIDFKQEVVEAIFEVGNGLDKEEIESLIEIPPSYDMGDYAFACFRLAKTYRKAPNLIAKELAVEIDGGDCFQKIESVGPYINFFINKAKLTKTVIDSIRERGTEFGSTDIGQGRKALVEFSSPNIAKPFHIGHIRSTVIGNSLYKIFKFQGFDTERLNHLGDYGTQFGMLIAAYRKWGDMEAIEADPINELLKLYVKFNEEAEKDESLKEEARYWFKELENGNEDALELWQWIRDVSLKEFNKVYNLLGIEFDSYTGESFYSDKMPGVIEEMEQKGLLEESEGAAIIDLEDYGMPPALIKKSDGSTLYTTRDIAAAIYRKEHYNFNKNIYVVGSQQNLHFKQWIKVIELMGYDWADDCVHVPFGMVSLEDGTLSTRRGRVVFLEDVLEKAIASTLKIMEERNPDLDNKEEVAKEVGIGAIIFQELFNNRIKDYVFSWERTLSFEGETGPYVQYTHARANSLLQKGNFNPDDAIDYALLDNDDEIGLIRLLYKFPDAVIDALDRYEPSIITRHIIEITKAFNKFYNSCPVLSAEKELKSARLMLVYVTKMVLKVGLGLLGIKAPDRM
ncbi:MAG: arginine--tRNA ligase [Tissierellia bacterium]|nr:arginine--tRNA ligase [Tissierellia bacterium]